MDTNPSTAGLTPPDSRSDDVRSLLTLRSCAGLGPVLLARLRTRFGSARATLERSAGELRSVEGIGEARAKSIVGSFAKARDMADQELARAAAMGIEIIPDTDPRFPPLLRPLRDAPPLLYVRGSLERARYPVAIVGSRRCSAHALEQAGRFAESLSRSGLTIVSGGARGIDTAAHRGAVRAGGTTLAVLGCGLNHCYPPENAGLFDRIAGDGEHETSGAIISELPLDTPPVAENFPARNRIISGISLGVLVIEAAKRSGALITARLAVEEHNREVLALPGRVGEDACAGTNELLRSGGAGMVLEPSDVVHQLESAAHHLYSGTHADRFAQTELPEQPTDTPQIGATREPGRSIVQESLPESQRALLAELDEARTVDELVDRTGRGAAQVRSDLTLLELGRLIVREGSRVRRR